MHARRSPPSSASRTAIVPPLAGLFSAAGLLFARTELHDVRFCHVAARAPDLDDAAQPRRRRCATCAPGERASGCAAPTSATAGRAGTSRSTSRARSTPRRSAALVDPLRGASTSASTACGRGGLAGRDPRAAPARDRPGATGPLSRSSARAVAGGTRLADFGDGAIDDAGALARVDRAEPAGPAARRRVRHDVVVPPGWIARRPRRGALVLDRVASSRRRTSAPRRRRSCGSSATRSPRSPTRWRPRSSAPRTDRRARRDGLLRALCDRRARRSRRRSRSRCTRVDPDAMRRCSAPATRCARATSRRERPVRRRQPHARHLRRQAVFAGDAPRPRSPSRTTATSAAAARHERVRHTEVFQEGLRLPWLRLATAASRRGVCEIPRERAHPARALGDLDAQLAACTIGERGLQELAGRAARLAERWTAARPHGGAPRRDRAAGPTGRPRDSSTPTGSTSRRADRGALAVAGDELVADLSESAPMVRGALNCTRSFAEAARLHAVMAAARHPRTGGARARHGRDAAGHGRARRAGASRRGVPAPIRTRQRRARAADPGARAGAGEGGRRRGSPAGRASRAHASSSSARGAGGRPRRERRPANPAPARTPGRGGETEGRARALRPADSGGAAPRRAARARWRAARTRAGAPDAAAYGRGPGGERAGGERWRCR